MTYQRLTSFCTRGVGLFLVLCPFPRFLNQIDHIQGAQEWESKESVVGNPGLCCKTQALKLQWNGCKRTCSFPAMLKSFHLHNVRFITFIIPKLFGFRVPVIWRYIPLFRCFLFWIIIVLFYFLSASASIFMCITTYLQRFLKSQALVTLEFMKLFLSLAYQGPSGRVTFSLRHGVSGYRCHSSHQNPYDAWRNVYERICLHESLWGTIWEKIGNGSEGNSVINRMEHTSDGIRWMDQSGCWEDFIGCRIAVIYISSSCIVRQGRAHQNMSYSGGHKLLVELCLGLRCTNKALIPAFLNLVCLTQVLPDTLRTVMQWSTGVTYLLGVGLSPQPQKWYLHLVWLAQDLHRQPSPT